MFLPCTNLTAVCSLNPSPPVCDAYYCFSEITYSDATLYVLSGTTSAYLSSTVWMEFASINDDSKITGIEDVTADDVDLSLSITDGELSLSGLNMS